MNNFTDEERVIIADKEYKDLEIKDEISVGDNTLGYVSQANDKSTGEQSFVITDK